VEHGVASVDRFGTCYDIMRQTNDTYSIVHEFPDPSSYDPDNWQGVVVDDDIVISHGESLNLGHYEAIQNPFEGGGSIAATENLAGADSSSQAHLPGTSMTRLFVMIGLVLMGIRRVWKSKRGTYTALPTAAEIGGAS